MQKPHILVIDGQGGRMGRLLVEQIRERFPAAHLRAVGTNAMATASLLKAGADAAATGENAVLVACRTADVIIGPLGIVIADALLGEITPAMAAAVGQSRAVKLLLPVNKCDHLVVGTKDVPLAELIRETVDMLADILK